MSQELLPCRLILSHELRPKNFGVPQSLASPLSGTNSDNRITTLNVNDSSHSLSSPSPNNSRCSASESSESSVTSATGLDSNAITKSLDVNADHNIAIVGDQDSSQEPSVPVHHEFNYHRELKNFTNSIFGQTWKRNRKIK